MLKSFCDELVVYLYLRQQPEPEHHREHRLKKMRYCEGFSHAHELYTYSLLWIFHPQCKYSTQCLTNFPFYFSHSHHYIALLCELLLPFNLLPSKKKVIYQKPQDAGFVLARQRSISTVSREMNKRPCLKRDHLVL